MLIKEHIAQINNKDVYRYILENEYIKLEIFNLGCIINQFIYKPLKQNIVLGYEFVEKYLSDTAYMGRIVGPTAGRIENAEYTINGIIYKLEKNENENNLHSGEIGISNDVFNAFEIDNGIEFRLIKNVFYDKINIELEFAIQYMLEDNNLIIKNYCTTNKDIFINMTNHTYFKLDNSKDIKEHYLKINSDKIYKIKENKVPYLEETDVENTNFDLKNYKQIKDVLEKGLKDEMKDTLGIDNPYLINRQKNKELELATSLYSEKNKLEINIYTTEDVVVCYTGNYLDMTLPMNDYKNLKYCGIALETQNHPNIINDDNIDKNKYITKPDRPYFSQTKIELKRR